MKPTFPPFLHAVGAYARTLWLGRRLKDRAAIERHQARALDRLVAHARANIPFYRGAGAEFESFPIIDKAVQQGDFARFNQAGITLDELIRALETGAETVRSLHFGQSTGTSGNRGRFVISDAERFTWLGTIIAKAIPDALFRRRRVALALPGFSSLYRSAPQGSRIRLSFFDLSEGVATWRREFLTFDPDTLVAPPKILRQLAEEGALKGVEAFSGAEILDPIDRRIVERGTGRPVREIYMATEGLFGVSCRQGRLHLAEDVVRFEWEQVPGSHLVVPIVTDLVRRVQPMIRYRMNDLLELDPAQCPCGSVFQPVRQVHGRMDDLFLFEREGGSIAATPDIVRNAVVDAHPAIEDFRVVQKADGRIVLSLPDHLDESVHRAAAEGLKRALRRLGVDPIVTTASGIAPRLDRKLRRVEREHAD